MGPVVLQNARAGTVIKCSMLAWNTTSYCLKCTSVTAALEIQLVLFEEPVQDCSLGILHYAEVRHKNRINLFIIRDALSYNVAKQYL